MPTEIELRQDLAACYKLFDWMGWSELIFNHITLRLPDQDDGRRAYLINSFGLHYAEVTADNLVAIDLDGRPLHTEQASVNQAGFVIHSAIHRARPDAHCIMHIHTTEGCAVSSKESGMRHDNFYSAMLYDDVAYHDFEGVTTREDEQPRLVASLGNKNHMILRNHGLLVVGPDLPTTFNRMWVMQRACEIQLASDAGKGDNRPIHTSVLEEIPQTRVAKNTATYRLIFDAMLRKAGITR